MTTATRPLWYLGHGHIPVRADGKKRPRDVTHFAREGDERWTPIDEPMREPQAEKD